MRGLLDQRLTIGLVIVISGAPNCSTTAQAQDSVTASPASVGDDSHRRVVRFGDPLPVGATLRLGTIRLRSGHSVEGVAFSPDGSMVVSTGWEDSIRFWDVNTGALVRRLVTDADEATFAAAFSPDGARLASVGDRGLVRLWDLQSGNLVSKVLGHVNQTFGERVYGVAFAPDGLTFATAGGDNSVGLWDSGTGEELLKLQHDEQGGGDAHAVAFSPDGSLLAAGSPQGRIRIWNLAEGREATVIKSGHQREVVSLAFMTDGKHLISGGSRFKRTGKRTGRMMSELHIWSVPGGEKQGEFDAEEELEGSGGFAMSGDGRFLVSGHHGKLAVWDVEKRVLIRFIDGAKEHFGGRTHQIAISPDNRLVAAGTFGVGTNKVYLWELATGKPVLPQDDIHTETVLAMDMSPDGKTIATGSGDGTVRLWNAATGEHVKLLDEGAGWVRYVEFFQDGERLALGRETHSPGKLGFEGEAKICRLDDGKVLHHFATPDRVMCGAAADDGEMLAVGIGLGDMMPFGPGADQGECKILVWDARSGQKISEMVGPKSQYLQVVFGADGTLWSTSEDQSVRQWNTADGQQKDDFKPELSKGRRHAWQLIIPGTSQVAARELERVDRSLRRGKLAVTGFDGEKTVWEKTFAESWPRQFAVSADGKLLAAFLYPLSGFQAGRRIAVFAVDDGQELVSFELEDGNVRSLAFSPDGRRLMTGMEASDALVWELPAYQ